MQMPSEMLAAIKTQLVDPARGWQVKSVSEHFHTETAISVVGGESTTTETVKRQVTITLQSAVMGRALLFMLEGDESGPFESGTANLMGNTFEFDDAQLLTWCQNATDAFGPVAIEALMQSYFGPIPEPDPEDS